MENKMMICPDKLSGKCKATGSECNHAVKHKKNKWCDRVLGTMSCPKCAPVEEVKGGK